jgi:hypothetical protein
VLQDDGVVEVRIAFLSRALLFRVDGRAAYDGEVLAGVLRFQLREWAALGAEGRLLE